MIHFNCAICNKTIQGIAYVLDNEHIVHHECRNEIERKNNWNDTQLLQDIIEHEKEKHVEWMSKL
jgi:hypothetical protein